LKDEARELLRRNLDLVRASDRYTARQKAEICASILSDTTGLHGRHYTSTSSSGCHSYYKQVLDAYANGTTPSELISDCPEITYVITEPGFSGLKEPGASHRHVYVIFYTKSLGKSWAMTSPSLGPHMHHLSRIPKTTGKSIYSVDPISIDRKIVAMGGVGFDETSIDTPKGFETNMRNYLTLWRSSPLTVLPSIQGMAKEFSFSKTTFHWSSIRMNDVNSICATLDMEFGICITPVFMKGTQDTFCVKTISW
jgi:hypothetical protein